MGMWVFEQSARFGAPVESLFQLALFSLESPVDGSGADRQQLLLGLGQDRQAFDGPGEPQQQPSFEPRRARVGLRLPR